MTTALSGSLGPDMANLSYFSCKSFPEIILFFWDLPLLCAYIPDALQLNEHRSREQTHCRKIQQKIKLTYVVLKTGISYESERQREGLWQVSAKGTTFLAWQLHLRQKLSLSHRNFSHFHFKTWNWILLSVTFNGHGMIFGKKKYLKLLLLICITASHTTLVHEDNSSKISKPGTWTSLCWQVKQTCMIKTGYCRSSYIHYKKQLQRSVLVFLNPQKNLNKQQQQKTSEMP